MFAAANVRTYKTTYKTSYQRKVEITHTMTKIYSYDYPGPKISQNVNYNTQRGTIEGPKGPSEARRRGVPRGGVRSGEGRRSTSPENFEI